jgi:predicted transcriptional regulator
MDETIKINFKQSTVNNLLEFSEVLNKDVNIMIEEAIEQYLANEHRKLFKQSIEEDSTITTFEYDEFWDGLDIV